MSLLERVGRYARTDRTRAVYDWLATHGATAARMVAFDRSTADSPSWTVPGDVAVETRTADEIDRSNAPFDELAGDDRAVLARVDGDVVGHAFCSTRPVYEPVVGGEVVPDGGYVWRVAVDPAHRRRGIATALVARSVALAADSGADRIGALVAADNAPSKAVFRSLGFERRGTHSYYRLGSFVHRSPRERRGGLRIRG